MKYRWIEDSVQSIEFPDGEILILYQGKEFEIPDSGEKWIERSIALGKIEKIVGEPNEIKSSPASKSTRRTSKGAK